MKRFFLHSKIHRATVTGAEIEYDGSLSIDPHILELSDIKPFERIEVYNITNGERFSTYTIVGKEGEFCVNGAAAWKAKPGDKIIIAAYATIDEEEHKEFKPRILLLGDDNVVNSVM